MRSLKSRANNLQAAVAVQALMAFSDVRQKKKKDLASNNAGIFDVGFTTWPILCTIGQCKSLNMFFFTK